MKEFKQIAFILILCISVLSLSIILKYRQNSYPPTYDEYYHIKEISAQHKFSDLFNDRLIYPLDLLLSFSKNPGLFMRLLPYLFGPITILTVYFILKKLALNERQILFTCIFIILSPIYIFIHTTYNDVFLSLSFILIGTALLLYDKYFFGLLLFLSAFSFNPRIFFIILLILIIFYEKMKSKGILLPLGGLFAVTYFFLSISKAGFSNEFTLASILTTYFSDFGAVAGFGIFSFILGFIGIAISWKDKKSNAIIYYSLFSLLIALLFDTRMMVFSELIFAYYSGLAFIYIWETHWESQTLKNYFILLIFCGIIFSFGSFVTRLPKEGPQRGEVISLEWLNNREIQKSISYYEYGYMINALSKNDVYTDKNYFLSSLDKTKIKKSEEFFQSRNLKNITAFLDKEEIGYIWINSKMKEGQVWEKENQGLLFVLEYSNYFKRIYSYQGTDIWQYTKKA